MLLRLGRRCRRFEPCHSDQRQVAAPNHRGRAEQILAIYHDGEVRILTVSPDQQAVPAPKIGCSYCLFFCSSHDGEVCCEHSAKIGFESNLKPQTHVVFYDKNILSQMRLRKSKGI